jgi:PAS domain S-box-containing protein
MDIKDLITNLEDWKMSCLIETTSEFGASAAVMYRFDNDMFVFEMGWPGDLPDFLLKLDISRSHPRALEKLKTNFPYAESIDMYPHDLKEILFSNGTKEMLFTPIFINNRLWGCLCIIYKENRLHINHIPAATVIADRIARQFNLYDLAHKSKEADDRLRTFLELIGEAYCTINEDGIITSIADNIAHFNDMKKEDMVGQNFLNFIHPEDHSRILKIVDMSKLGKINTEGRLRIRGCNWIWCKAYFMPIFETCDGNKIFRGNIIVMIYIHDLKTQILEMTSSLNEYEAFFTNMEAAFMFLDQDYNIFKASPQCSRLIGYEQAYILGKCMKDIIHPEDIDKLPLFSDETSYRFIVPGGCRVLMNDGTYRPFFFEFGPCSIGTGGIVYPLIIKKTGATQGNGT